jgi:hypothetical protein
LEDEDGRLVSDHLGKAALIWQEYKKRLHYCTISTQIHFNLQELIQRHDLHQIDLPFTKEDINNVIKMPLDKAPGANGFNGLFLKKFCHIIKEDVYDLCMDFFNGVVVMQAINNSFITLIPKVNTPTNINDFRPISLLNCVVKIITKLMGDILQSVVIPLVHQN